MRGKGGLAGGRTVEHGITPAYAGKASGAMSGSDMDRITPAYAGKSCKASQAHLRRWDHPRVCGEKGEGEPFSFSKLGSPPACAGKSASGRRAGSRGRDHPRMCGEKIKGTGRRDTKKGSPPHVRGKVYCLWMGGWRIWITPACAGKSRQNRFILSADKDHPRMCGEKRRRLERRHAG